MVDQLAANHGTTSHREIVVIGLRSGTDGARTGWGECAALPTRGYTSHSAYDCYEMLTRSAPGLIGRPVDTLVEPTGRAPGVGAQPLISATVEMAAFDAIGKIQGRALAAMLGVSTTGPERSAAPSVVSAGATVGLGTSHEVSFGVRRLIEAGYRRIKLKVQPGCDLDIVNAARSQLDGLGIDQSSPASAVQWQVDANGSYRVEDMETLVALANLEVAAIEQPFAVDDVTSAAALVAELANRNLRCRVVADEAAQTTDAIQALAESKAATAVAIKPYRFGGLAAATAAIDMCHNLGLEPSIGGMIESALGRSSLAPLAALTSPELIGDLSPSGRWLARDPWPDLATSMRTPEPGVPAGLYVTVPDGPGVAPPPDMEMLDAVTTQQAVFGP